MSVTRGRLALVLVLTASAAHADVTAAARAFSEGQAAQLAGDFERAAQDYELAYTIVPSKEALRSAVRARLLANQLARAATLAEVLAASYADDPASQKLASEVLADARPKLAKVELVCAASCTVAADGKALPLATAARHVFYLAPGKHPVEVGFGGGVTATPEVQAAAGTVVVLEVGKPEPQVVAPPPPPPPPHQEQLPPPPPPPPPPPHRGGLPRWVALGGGAITAVFAVEMIVYGIKTQHDKDTYDANPTPATWDIGHHDETVTNGAIILTSVFGLTTAYIAIFQTRWHDDAAPTVSVQPMRGGAAASLGWRF
jgi:hypothetical protein